MPRNSKKVKTSGNAAQLQPMAAMSAPASGATTPRTTTAAHSSARKQLRGRTGGLRNMPNMPLDILIEIFSYLHPLDLLDLARTTKPFRALLMSRSFAGVWRASRKLIQELPVCPGHLSEPAYANLVFSSHCHNCLKPNVKSIIWEFMARYCRPCKKIMTVKITDKHTCAEFFCMQYAELSPLVNMSPLKASCIYHLPQLQQVKQAWEEYHDDKEKWSKYVEEQKKRAEAIQDHAYDCVEWMESVGADKEYRLEKVREKRLQFIVARLREMGWEDEIERLPEDLFPLSDHPQVRMAREISERTWEKIRGELASYMRRLKEHRITEERSTILHIRLHTLDAVINKLRSEAGRSYVTEFLPKFPDYALMPEFRTLMEAPTEDMLDMRACADWVVRLDELDTRWILERKKRLARMVEKALGRVPEDADDAPPADDDTNDRSYEAVLKLAIAVFECKWCAERVHASNALAHRCTRGDGRLWLLDLGPRETEGTYMYEMRRISRALRPWDASCLRVPDLEPLRKVIQMCGKDPETVTEEDMDKLEMRLAVKGQLVDGKQKVLMWDALLCAGHLDPVVCESDWQLEVLSEDAMRRAVELEAAREEKFVLDVLNPEAKYWCCRLCDGLALGGSYIAAFTHVRDIHDKLDNEDDFVFMHPDVTFMASKASPVLLPLT
ncbi:hypothetical protein FOMPIDRAFT_1052210 [Fomitopsis schrenkii]|uniref:F-box domain-containing protein n=1 Tax=Fomitopsis schrenkii TaxID=2126942 RepID=S8FGW8_FOMSC|nr:hypothetical protein FOMPIDRAFT_1052210 [Fomitopsis schrenkii]